MTLCGANGGTAGGRRTGAGWSGVAPAQLCLARGPQAVQQHHNPSRHLSVAKQPAVNEQQLMGGISLDPPNIRNPTIPKRKVLHRCSAASACAGFTN
eukprot:COSAG04_NODE_3498_length_2768_cov_153.658299_3_plen_97_part_00